MKINRTDNSSRRSGYGKQAWTTTPADYDILAHGPGYVANLQGQASKAITIGVAGTLVVTFVENQANPQTIAYPAGTHDIEAIYLGAASTAQNVSVHW